MPGRRGVRNVRGLLWGRIVDDRLHQVKMGIGVTNVIMCVCDLFLEVFHVHVYTYDKVGCEIFV